jgi:hypothetical protein
MMNSINHDSRVEDDLSSVEVLSLCGMALLAQSAASTLHI